MKCPKCGAENYDNAVYCTSCGEALQNTQEQPPQQPAYPQQPQQGGYQQPQQPAYQQPMYQQQPVPQVNNYLVWSILVTIFCCLPFGIAAIVFSSKVNTLLAQGNYAGAMDASKKAKTWCIVGAIGFVVVLIFYIILFATGLMNLDSLTSYSKYY